MSGRITEERLAAVERVARGASAPLARVDVLAVCREVWACWGELAALRVELARLRERVALVEARTAAPRSEP